MLLCLVGGDKVTSAGLNKVKHVLLTSVLDADENVRMASAVCIGAMCCVMIYGSGAAAPGGSDATRNAVMDCIVDLTNGGTLTEQWTATAGRYQGCAMALQSLGSAITAAGAVSTYTAATAAATEETRQSVFSFLQSGLSYARASVRLAACRFCFDMI